VRRHSADYVIGRTPVVAGTLYARDVTYRDTFETCPRCGVNLVDAGSARACPECRGQWIEEAVVSDMVLEMLPVQPLSRLELAVLERTNEPVACPTCKQPMHATAIHGVPLERCAKHGVWFDAGELQLALQRVADPARKPPLVPLGPRKLHAGGQTVELRVAIHTGDTPAQQLVFTQQLVKIGRIATSDIRLVDARVNRMHAIIDATAPDSVWIIDLGSSHGTFVDGKRINKARLNTGDRITLGGSAILISIGPVR
jgi:Zn-finger nucleic acid-binding protein